MKIVVIVSGVEKVRCDV